MEILANILQISYFATMGNVDLLKPGIIYVTNIPDFEMVCHAYNKPAGFYIPELPHITAFWRLENQKLSAFIQCNKRIVHISS